MKTLPPDVSGYKKTPEFTETSVPAGLLREHSTKENVWGRICVLEGELEYEILEPERETHLLSPGHDGVVEPTMLHHVKPLGKVRFFVEFLRAPR
jgi:tellurite resistance-related uncharacterized protein